MIPLISAVFVSSLLGSTHCAGMCGAFLAMAIGGGSGPRGGLMAAYHAGRLATYLVLGLLAGLVGSAADLAGATAGVHHAAMLGSGAIMLAVGVTALLRAGGVRVVAMRVPTSWHRAVAGGLTFADRWSPPARALALGLLTTLLPCGWLWTFVITAAGTGHWWTGGVTMGVFWLGTLPVLVALGVGAAKLLGPAKRALPVLTSLALVVFGALTLAGRTIVALPVPGSPGSRTELVCHGR